MTALTSTRAPATLEGRPSGPRPSRRLVRHRISQANYGQGSGRRTRKPWERCESGRIGLTANELTWVTGSEGSNPSLSARAGQPARGPRNKEGPPRGPAVRAGPAGIGLVRGGCAKSWVASSCRPLAVRRTRWTRTSWPGNWPTAVCCRRHDPKRQISWWSTPAPSSRRRAESSTGTGRGVAGATRSRPKPATRSTSGRASRSSSP